MQTTYFPYHEVCFLLVLPWWLIGVIIKETLLVVGQRGYGFQVWGVLGICLQFSPFLKYFGLLLEGHFFPHLTTASRLLTVIGANIAPGWQLLLDHLLQ
jgi:hypothetical protein